MTTQGGSTPLPGRLPEGKHSSLLHLKAREANKVWKAEPARQYSGTSLASRTKGRQQEGREAEVLSRLWGWRTCDRCGETIVLGEETFRLRLDRSTEEVCSGCAQALAIEPSNTPVLALPDRLPVSIRVRSLPWFNQTGARTHAEGRKAER
jgi:hypothetical protein